MAHYEVLKKLNSNEIRSEDGELSNSFEGEDHIYSSNACLYFYLPKLQFLFAFICILKL